MKEKILAIRLRDCYYPVLIVLNLAIVLWIVSVFLNIQKRENQDIINSFLIIAALSSLLAAFHYVFSTKSSK